MKQLAVLPLGLIVLMLSLSCASRPHPIANPPDPQLLQATRASALAPNPTDTPAPVSDAELDFGLKLFKSLDAQAKAGNVFISPSSVAGVLRMAMLGAGGQTREALAKALGDDPSNPRATTKNDYGPNVIVEVANSLWARKMGTFWFLPSQRIKPKYVKEVRQRFGAQAAELDFRDPNSAKVVNDWIAKRTHGKISQGVDRLDPMAVLMLVNAVYFKGRWMDVFDPQLTRDETFHLAEGGETKVRMMSQKGEYAYGHGPGYQAICLPYGKGRTEMLIILPQDVMGLDSLIRELDVARWREILKAMRSQEGTIELPRFETDYQAMLNDALKERGLGVAFNPAQADFSGILKPLRDVNFAISDVWQMARVEVNEEGAEAAAVTLMTLAAEAMPVNPPPPFKMVVDHPFLCAIRDSQTGEILFIGAIRKP